MESIVATTTVANFVEFVSAPTQLRQGDPTVVGAMTAYNSGTALVFVQLHSVSPTPGLVPLYVVPVNGNGGFSIIGGEHLWGAGIAARNMWVGISSTMGTYTAAVGPTGTLQLMLK